MMRTFLVTSTLTTFINNVLFQQSIYHNQLHYSLNSLFSTRMTYDIYDSLCHLYHALLTVSLHPLCTLWFQSQYSHCARPLWDIHFIITSTFDTQLVLPAFFTIPFTCLYHQWSFLINRTMPTIFLNKLHMYFYHFLGKSCRTIKFPWKIIKAEIHLLFSAFRDLGAQCNP